MRALAGVALPLAAAGLISAGVNDALTWSPLLVACGFLAARIIPPCELNRELLPELPKIIVSELGRALHLPRLVITDVRLIGVGGEVRETE